jgi:hypothetical protein
MLDHDTDNSCPVIDSRDVIDRLARADVRDAALKMFAAEASAKVAGWGDGVLCVRDSYFREHIEQAVYDVGSNIDLDVAVDAARKLYSSADYGGVRYWLR